MLGKQRRLELPAKTLPHITGDRPVHGRGGWGGPTGECPSPEHHWLCSQPVTLCLHILGSLPAFKHGQGQGCYFRTRPALKFSLGLHRGPSCSEFHMHPPGHTAGHTAHSPYSPAVSNYLEFSFESHQS